MGTLSSELSRRRAGRFYQTGSLAFGAIAVFVLVTWSSRLSLSTLGWIVAAMIVLPSLAAFGAPAQSMIREHGAHQTAVRIWHEFKSTFLRWEAIPYTLLVGCPCCSGAMIGLLPQLARDYHVTGHEVAWINGVAGALLTSAGASPRRSFLSACARPLAFLSAGLANAATLAIFALGPCGPPFYFTGTVLSSLRLARATPSSPVSPLNSSEASGKSGSLRYAIINSIGNLPVSYMIWLDGRGYRALGPRAMPGVDANHYRNRYARSCSRTHREPPSQAKKAGRIGICAVGGQRWRTGVFAGEHLAAGRLHTRNSGGTKESRELT